MSTRMFTRARQTLVKALPHGSFKGQSLHTQTHTHIQTHTTSQNKYEASIRDPRNSVIIGHGPAGTGKTYVPCKIAIEMLQKKEISKILITRPAVCVDESHGYLPGDIESKMMPYMRPIYDCFQKSISPETLRLYLKNEVIEICPLSYIRGRTFSDCFLLADEMQNSTSIQTKTLLTRIGENCKVVLTGDLSQSDLKTPMNGLADILDRIEEQYFETDECCIDVIKFENNDVLRSKIVMDILELYKRR
jgi:phosphate starvation-inducible PhoH-like protein